MRRRKTMDDVARLIRKASSEPHALLHSYVRGHRPEMYFLEWESQTGGGLLLATSDLAKFIAVAQYAVRTFRASRDGQNCFDWRESA